jgi:Uma2 family endonuclease
MAMPMANSDWTVDLLDELPDDGNRYEIVDGALLVTPAPSDVHQLVIGELHARLRDYLRGGSIGRAIFAPADVRRDDRRKNRVQPDLFVVRLIGGVRPPYPFDLRDLLLAVEVASPSSAAADHHLKRELYMTSGVDEYWIVDVEARTFAVWRNGSSHADLLTDELRWHPDGVSHAFTMAIPEFFAAAVA